MKAHSVFVYGTLQKGCSNHVLLAGSTLLGPALTQASFVMLTLVDEDGRRGIPFVGSDLPGLLYQVLARGIQALDRCEGLHGGHYRREAMEVTVGPQNGRAPHKATAWVHLAGEAFIQEGLPVAEHCLEHIRRGHAILGIAPPGLQRSA